MYWGNSHSSSACLSACSIASFAANQWQHLLTASVLESSGRVRPDLGYVGASARKVFQSDRSKASEPTRLLSQLPDLVRTATQIATFKVKVKRKTTHRHLFLPKDYSGSPTASLYTPWSEAEVLSHLTAGWGEGAITELKLEYLYGPEPEVSGNSTVNVTRCYRYL